MRGLDAIRDLPKESHRTLDRKRPFASQKSMKRLTLDILHYKVKNPVVRFTEIRNAYSVGMLN